MSQRELRTSWSGGCHVSASMPGLRIMSSGNLTIYEASSVVLSCNSLQSALWVNTQLPALHRQRQRMIRGAGFGFCHGDIPGTPSSPKFLATIPLTSPYFMESSPYFEATGFASSCMPKCGFLKSKQPLLRISSRLRCAIAAPLLCRKKDAYTAPN